LRFWNLDAKPLWMDEIITALFSSGHSYYDVPLEEVVAVSAFDRVFQFEPAATCANIAQTISVQSVHPPLFFCWLHNWLQWTAPLQQSWVWQIRSLPAIAGIVSIGVVYAINREAFSKTAGLMAALVMAVSPFAVYLSQEARHYTVPMVFSVIALLGLIQVQKDLQQRHIRYSVWLGWIVVNAVGFYIHYFFILAVVAQIFALIVVQVRLHQVAIDQHPENTTPLPLRFAPIVVSTIIIAAFYLPWLPTFLGHMGRSETDWLAVSQTGILSAISPLGQLLAGWFVMTIALPVENQPLWIAIPSGLTMVIFEAWLVWRVVRGLQRLWNDPKTHWETLTLINFVLCILLEFLAIVYVLQKDITQVPRYNFIYFPAVCILMGASLWAKNREEESRNRRLITPAFVFLAGCLSCVFVVYNLVFLKPYYPDKVAYEIVHDIVHENTAVHDASHSEKALVIMAYKDFQDIALGLSFALSLPREELFAFVGASQGYETLWRSLPRLKNQQQSPQQLWIIAPGLRRTDFPITLSTSGRQCTLKPAAYHRIGIPYQGYDCET
jgi:uncharacterized membrane protein